MQCVSVDGVAFDRRSLDAIEDIKRKNSISVTLSRMMPIGTMANIFLGNGVLKSSYNIYSTDFEALSCAMASLPQI